ncbi:MAG: hypothetical protein Fur0022_05330 [Anaerolineales bacterium]
MKRLLIPPIKTPPILPFLAFWLSLLACKTLGGQTSGGLPFLAQPTPTPAVYSLQIQEPTLTEIHVEPGDYVWITASGNVTLGMFAGSTGPAGTSSMLLSGYSTVPDLPHGALLCRVKGDKEWQYCGAELEFQPSRKGVLELTVNDEDRGNNIGAFQVQVVVSAGYSARAQAQEAASSASEDSPDSDAESDPDNPRNFLAGELDCFPVGWSYMVNGSIQNKSDRPIILEMTLSVFADGNVFDTSVEYITLPPGEDTFISFSGGSIPDPYAGAPPDNPDTPEYEPEMWAESYGIPEYSCQIHSTATWGDQ